MAKSGERQVPGVEITQWTGMASNVSPHVMRPSDATLQVNLMIQSRGVLETRGGFRKVEFED